MVLVIGVCGASASGKTSICKKLHKNLLTRLHVDSNLIHLDNYFMDKKDYIKHPVTNEYIYDSPHNIDFNSAIKDIVHLSLGESIQKPIRCIDSGNVIDYVTTEPKPVIILEGIFALYHTLLRKQFDIHIYVDLDKPTLKKRRLKRDHRIDETYYDTYIEPAMNEFVFPYLEKQFNKPTLRINNNNIVTEEMIVKITDSINKHLQKY